MNHLLARACVSSCALLFAGSFAVGCDGGLPSSRGGGGSIPATISLSFFPDASADHAPGIGWEVLRSTGTRPPADQMRLYEGKLTSTELRAVVSGKTTPALDARLVPSACFPNGDGTALAPEQTLAEGDYTIVISDSGWNRTFHVTATEDPPVLARAWPPTGVAASPNALVYCAPDATSAAHGWTPVVLPSGRDELTLLPANVPGAFVSPLAAGSQCIRFTSDTLPDEMDGLVVPPPQLTISGTPLRLEPGSLPLSQGAPTDVVTCHAGERQFGPGCATVLDDRIKVRSPEGPVAWSIGGTSGVVFRSTRGGSRFVVRGFHPLASFKVAVTTIDTTGVEASSTFAGTTLAPMPHLLINEVYAHPVGPRPNEEWIEIFNDGPTEQSLYGFGLAVADVATPLPAVSIPPGGYALVVNFAYQPDDGVDLAPPTNCPLARVGKLGKSGLSLNGDLLHLLGPDGSVVSSFPAIGQHAAGVSAVRASPDAPDDDAGAFSLGAGPPTPCEPNAGM